MKFLDDIHEACITLTPSQRCWEIFRELVLKANATGNLVTDAGIAALAIDHDCRLASFDHDFARFAGLRWFVPQV